jgi:hypothetical protein
MYFDNNLSTQQISSIFTGEVSAAGGTVHETFDDGTRLFARSVLPDVADVRHGDLIRGGVAIRASNQEISFHPYTFRLVCKNGAIRAHAIESCVIAEGEFAALEETEFAVREAVRRCCAREVLAASVDEMRTAAADTHIDMLLTLAPMLAGMPAGLGQRLLADTLDRVAKGRSGSRYDLMNHVTAAARETRDPGHKWRLEELGGAIGARRMPTPKPITPARRELVAV